MSVAGSGQAPSHGERLAGVVTEGIGRAWRNLGAPEALNWPVALLYLPFGLAGPLLIDPTQYGGSIWLWLLVGLCGQLTITLTLLAFRRRALRHPSPILTLIGIATAVAIRAVALASVALAVGLTPSWEIGYRLTTAVGAQFGILVFLTITVSTSGSNREITRRLFANQEALERTSERAQEALRDLYAEIAVRVRTMVEPLIGVLDTAGRRTSADHAAVHATIQQMIDNELRPLSHGLATAEYKIPEFSPSSSRADAKRFALPKTLPMSMLIRPFGASMFAALLAGSQAFRGLPILDAIAFPIFFCSVVGLLLWSARMTLRFDVQVWVGIAASALATGLTFWVSLNLVLVFGLALPEGLGGAALATGTYVGALLAASAALNEQQFRMQGNLLRSTDEIQVHISAMRQQDFIARKQLSYIIHGSVQSSLHAAVLKLSTSDRPSPELIAGIRQDIDAALARLEPSTSPYVLLIQSLDDIAELWNGAATVRWTLDHRTVRRLVHAPSTAAAVAEVITEAVGNAVRHGRATEVSVSIEPAETWIELRVVDNGIGVTSTPREGLGTRMMNELCLRWNRTSDELGTILVAEIAIVDTTHTLAQGSSA